MSDVNPEMVALARLSRGLTQAELATHMGITQGTVSKLEIGLIPATIADVERLAAALGYPPSFFNQDEGIPDPGLSELFHRKRQRAGSRELNRIHAIADIRVINTNQLYRSWEQDSEIPTLPVDQFDGDPEKIARTVRAIWQLPPGPVFNVT